MLTNTLMHTIPEDDRGYHSDSNDKSPKLLKARILSKSINLDDLLDVRGSKNEPNNNNNNNNNDSEGNAAAEKAMRRTRNRKLRQNLNQFLNKSPVLTRSSSHTGSFFSASDVPEDQLHLSLGPPALSTSPMPNTAVLQRSRSNTEPDNNKLLGDTNAQHLERLRIAKAMMGERLISLHDFEDLKHKSLGRMFDAVAGESPGVPFGNPSANAGNGANGGPRIVFGSGIGAIVAPPPLNGQLAGFVGSSVTAYDEDAPVTALALAWVEFVEKMGFFTPLLVQRFDLPDLAHYWDSSPTAIASLLHVMRSMGTSPRGSVESTANNSSAASQHALVPIGNLLDFLGHQGFEQLNRALFMQSLAQLTGMDSKFIDPGQFAILVKRIRTAVLFCSSARALSSQRDTPRGDHSSHNHNLDPAATSTACVCADYSSFGALEVQDLMKAQNVGFFFDREGPCAMRPNRLVAMASPTPVICLRLMMRYGLHPAITHLLVRASLFGASGEKETESISSIPHLGTLVRAEATTSRTHPAILAMMPILSPPSLELQSTVDESILTIMAIPAPENTLILMQSRWKLVGSLAFVWTKDDKQVATSGSIRKRFSGKYSRPRLSTARHAYSKRSTVVAKGDSEEISGGMGPPKFESQPELGGGRNSSTSSKLQVPAYAADPADCLGQLRDTAFGGAVFDLTRDDPCFVRDNGRVLVWTLQTITSNEKHLVHHFERQLGELLAMHADDALSKSLLAWDSSIHKLNWVVTKQRAVIREIVSAVDIVDREYLPYIQQVLGVIDGMLEQVADLRASMERARRFK